MTMRLENVSPIIRLRHQITETENMLVTPAHVDLLHSVAFLTNMASPVFAGLIAWWAGASVNWQVGVGVLMFIIVLIGFRKFLFIDRLYLPASILGFYRENRAEMNSIGTRVGQFNEALNAQKNSQRLILQAEHEDNEALAAYWEDRRKPLQEEAVAFIHRLRVAVKHDLHRITERNRTNPRLIRRAFNEKVWQLKQLEASLGNLKDGYDGTRDLSPYLAAGKLREQLEQERLELGLPDKALPKPKTRSLLLKAR
jgi:hypothetical protein